MLPVFEDPESFQVKWIAKVVFLLILVMLGGGIYLLFSGLFQSVEIQPPTVLPEINVAVQNYQGPVWKIEPAREQVLKQLVKSQIAFDQPITIFPVNPGKLRLLNVVCQVGFILPANKILTTLHPPLQWRHLQPGRRLVAWVKSTNQLTGSRAYGAAVKQWKKKGIMPAEGERYEIKTQKKGKAVIEHWIPVQ